MLGEATSGRLINRLISGGIDPPNDRSERTEIFLSFLETRRPRPRSTSMVDISPYPGGRVPPDRFPSGCCTGSVTPRVVSWIPIFIFNPSVFGVRALIGDYWSSPVSLSYISRCRVCLLRDTTRAPMYNERETTRYPVQLLSIELRK